MVIEMTMESNLDKAVKEVETEEKRKGMAKMVCNHSIKFCPICGRKMISEIDELDIFEDGLDNRIELEKVAIIERIKKLSGQNKIGVSHISREEVDEAVKEAIGIGG